MKEILSAAATLMDRSLAIGAVLLGLAVLRGVFDFIRLGFYSAGVGRTQAGVLAGALMVLTVVYLYSNFS
ncbi:MAG: hypothetical protein K6T66_15750 [Peptococcaceae bacterium]|nr:hypothetical protein [Peptococcaceae bacterium]